MATEGSASQVKVSADNAQSQEGLPLEHAEDALISANEYNFLIAQFTSLRDEILKRIELQHQLILGTLVAVGTFLTIGIQSNDRSILLVYPVLVIFLALAWSQNDSRNRQIADYLWKNEELFLVNPKIGWEHTRSSSRFWKLGSKKVLAARGIFLGSQFLVILLYALKLQTANQSVSDSEGILLIIDVTSVILTLLIIGKPSHGRPKLE